MAKEDKTKIRSIYEWFSTVRLIIVTDILTSSIIKIPPPAPAPAPAPLP